MIGLQRWEQTGLGGPLSFKGYMVNELGVEAHAHCHIIQEKKQHKIKSMLDYTWSSRPAWLYNETLFPREKLLRNMNFNMWLSLRQKSQTFTV